MEYFGFADGRPVDPLALLLVCGAFPPAVSSTWRPGGLGAHGGVHGSRAWRLGAGPAALRVPQRRFVQNGCLDEDGEVWDSRDQLVAQSRQIGLPQGVN